MAMKSGDCYVWELEAVCRRRQEELTRRRCCRSLRQRWRGRWRSQASSSYPRICASPNVLKRPFVRLAASYPELVARGVPSGLQDLVGAGQVWKHNQKVLYAGAFAVSQDAQEDRVIMAAAPVDQLLPKGKMAKARFALTPFAAHEGLQTLLLPGGPGQAMEEVSRDASSGSGRRGTLPSADMRAFGLRPIGGAGPARSARDELFLAALTMPLAVTQLDAEWSLILEFFDPAPGGHGRAYGRFPVETIPDVARWSIAKKGVHVGLALEHRIAVGEEKKYPLYRVPLPESTCWHEVPRSGGHSHITLGEPEACIGALGARLGREDGARQRLVLAGDNAAQIGAFQTGGSSSAPLNAECRRAGSIVLGGGLMPFLIWVSTKKNPVDRRSRVYGGAGQPGPARRQPKPTTEVVLEGPRGWAEAPFLAVMICRRADWADQVVWEARRYGLGLQVLTLETSEEASGLLAKETWAGSAEEGRVRALLRRRPRSTVSRLRFRSGGPRWPRPVRSHDRMWWPIARASYSELVAFHRESVLMLQDFSLYFRVSDTLVYAMLEQPSDPGDPFPSFSVAEECRWLMRHTVSHE